LSLPTQPEDLRDKNNNPVTMTPHAKQRAEERAVDEQEIMHVINNPIETIYDENNQTWKSYGKIIGKYRKEERILIVVHTKYNLGVKIVTMFWSNRGGLSFHGFSKL